MAIFGTKTVDQILADFSTTLTALTKRSEDLSTKVGIVQEKITKLYQERNNYSDELTRANAVAKKLRDFLSA
jgi:prefoldin subunit 5